MQIQIGIKIKPNAKLQKNIMKLNRLKKIVVTITVCFAFLGFYSCGDDLDGCGLTVVVTDTTGNRIPKANITVGVDVNGEIGSGETIKREATADKNGEAYFFFDNEAIFTIYAKVDSVVVRENGEELHLERVGKSTVQLKYDEMVTKNVIVP